MLTRLPAVLVALFLFVACQASTSTPEPIEPPQRMIRMMTDGYMRLAIEYGVDMDREHLYAMLDDSITTAYEEERVEFSVWDISRIGLADLFSSPADVADIIRESAIDDGESPLEHVQSLARQVKNYADRHSLP